MDAFIVNQPMPWVIMKFFQCFIIIFPIHCMS